MSKIVLTKNFKHTTGARYCAAEFGTPPDQAREVDGIALTNVEVVSVAMYPETLDFESFGCGLVMVGEGELPPASAAVPSNMRRVHWDGLDFVYSDDKENFKAAKRIEVGPAGMLVEA